jgi:pSer/pThr/pTyr-binding forkhead associated (FHA) protein
MRSQPGVEPEEGPAGNGVDTSAPMPDPAEIIEGATIKIHAPPPNTLKLLPGSFEVVAGEPEIEEIRLYRTSPDPEIETTIGRLPGEPYKHIQLKLQTVSRKQAKLVFSNGEYTLINYAPETSNPTRINGQEMGVNESRVLEEGDRIQMGEVELIYHSQ